MQNQIQIELLSPARNVETGIAAIDHGADAVYIGYEKFGAREAAGNPIVDIEKLVNYAHIFSSKVYITLNTILFEKELIQAQDIIHKLYNVGADAIIIQDMGILEMDLPPIPIHASTQTHNVSVEKIKFLEDIGIQRVVLARELSLSQIKRINESTNIELEAFIHGALCVSYSGQCYFSHAITGRSANRGACAQPCRSLFDLVDENGVAIVKNKHLLSLKDLNQTENIKNLIDAGVTSLKIEGRLKGIEYVKNITAHYRKIIDNIIASDGGMSRSSSGSIKYYFMPDPSKTFNRGFSEYFTNNQQEGLSSFYTQKSIGKFVGKVNEVNSKWFSIKTSEEINNNDGLCFFNKEKVLKGLKVNKVVDNKVFTNQTDELFKGVTIYRNYDHQFFNLLKNSKTATRQIQCKLQLVINESDIKINLIDEDKLASHVEINNIDQIATKPDSLVLNIENQLKKTGNTHFNISEISIVRTTSNVPFIAISQINALRRSLMENHFNLRLASYKRVLKRITPNSTPYQESSLTYKANVSNSLATNFYERHGAESIEKAFELQTNYSNKVIMETKYCILREIGYCNGKTRSEHLNKKLYLQDNNRRYPLHFDCYNCRMNISLE